MLSSATLRPINLTTTILDHNGVDISSSFEVRIFRHSLHDATSKTHNRTNPMNNLNDRTVTKTQFAQLVNACPANSSFVSSHCDPEAGGDFAMQQYVYNCKHMETTYSQATGAVIGSRPVFRLRDGHCANDEMCVQIHSPNSMAACVKVYLFDDFQIDKNGIVRGMLGGSFFSLDDMQMYASMSESDAKTVVELSRLEVDAWNGPESVDKAAAQSFRCRNCVDLNTGSFDADTNSLKVQATLLTSGAMTGILWLGLMSG